MESIELESTVYDVINSMDENTFTKSVVVKFFNELGFVKGSYNGGTNEFGKDAILVKPMGLDEYRIHIQSKKFKNCTSRADKDNLIVQITQCLNDESHDNCGKPVKSNKVYLISPDEPNSRTLELISRSIRKEDKDRFQLIEGKELVQLIKEKTPNLYAKLKPLTEKLTDESLLQKTNHELLSAINAKHYIDINRLYTDLSFFIGNVESKKVLQSVPNINRKPI